MKLFKWINMSKCFNANSTLKHKKSLVYRVFDICQCALTCSPINEEKWEAHVTIEGSWRKSHLNVRSIFLPNKIAVTESISNTEISHMDILFKKLNITPCGLPSSDCTNDLQRGSFSSEWGKFPQCLHFLLWRSKSKALDFQEHFFFIQIQF